jgi:hypothetical protein
MDRGARWPSGICTRIAATLALIERAMTTTGPESDTGPVAHPMKTHGGEGHHAAMRTTRRPRRSGRGRLEAINTNPS